MKTGCSRLRRIGAFLLAAVMLALGSACGKAPEGPLHGYQIEENTNSENKISYPYVVRTESATWYLAQADIDLMGEDAFYEGLDSILQVQDADFADARARLSGYIWDEIPPIDIYTDFGGNADISESAGAYYHRGRNFIKVFTGWDTTRWTLLHEYVHYLTRHCTDDPVQSGFFAEGIAEYIAMIACRDRMLRGLYPDTGAEEVSFLKSRGAWDEEEDCFDPLRYFTGLAEVYARGVMVGEEFYSTQDISLVRTEEIQQNPTPETVSHAEAAAIMAYLVETYSQDFVFSHLSMSTDEFETVYGEPFSAVYEHWAAWNAARCSELGLSFG